MPATGTETGLPVLNKISLGLAESARTSIRRPTASQPRSLNVQSGTRDWPKYDKTATTFEKGAVASFDSQFACILRRQSNALRLLNFKNLFFVVALAGSIICVGAAS